MIFVTVGTQLPFDRLVKAVDAWATEAGVTDVVAQVGPSQYLARAIHCLEFIPPSDFRQYAEQASLIVSHAGMGSIITACELGKPIIVMPRRAALHEHRSDHQVATVERMCTLQNVTVAMDEAELVKVLTELPSVGASDKLSRYASSELITTIREFVESPPAWRPTLRPYLPTALARRILRTSAPPSSSASALHEPLPHG